MAPVAVSHIAGQPINSTEQEVIGLLLAQQQVFTSSGKLEPSSVYVNQSAIPSSVAIVTGDHVLQPHGADSKAIVIVSFAIICSCMIYMYVHCKVKSEATSGPSWPKLPVSLFWFLYVA